MGGYDPYSSSKGAAELVVAAYRRSFFSAPTSLVSLASGRAGNVIGGGDWALDRIVPDCIRSLRRGEPIPVRNKVATRPWQHVLEPLGGYLWHWPGNWTDRSDPNALHEATLLNLAIDKAHHVLGWQPVWDFEETLAQTVAWYRKVAGDSSAARACTQEQIADYVASAQAWGLAWARPSSKLV